MCCLREFKSKHWNWCSVIHSVLAHLIQRFMYVIVIILRPLSVRLCRGYHFTFWLSSRRLLGHMKPSFAWMMFVMSHIDFLFLSPETYESFLILLIQKSSHCLHPKENINKIRNSYDNLVEIRLPKIFFVLYLQLTMPIRTKPSKPDLCEPLSWAPKNMAAMNKSVHHYKVKKFWTDQFLC